MQHLWQLCTRNLFTRKVRCLLSMTGVVLGVALLLSTAVTYDSALTNLKKIFRQSFGQSRIRLKPRYGSHLKPEHISAVRATNGVGILSPERSLWVTAKAGKRIVPFFLVAVHPEKESLIRRYPVVEGTGLAGTRLSHPLLLRDEAARRLRLTIGSGLTIIADGKQVEFTVVGIFHYRGIRWLQPTYTAVTTDRALETLDRECGIAEIDIITDARFDPRAVAASLEKKLGAETIIELPETRPAAFERNIRIAKLTARIISATALFVSMFIIFNTISMTVAERQREMGILRTLGCTKRQIFRLVLLESLILGLVGTALGVAAGIAVARWAVLSTTRDGEFIVSISSVLMSSAAGVSTFLLASLYPAWRAANVSAIEATLPYIRSRETTARRSPRFFGIALVGLALLTIHLPVGATLKVWLCITIGIFCLFLGLTLISSHIISPASRVLSPLLLPVILLTEGIARLAVVTLRILQNTMRNRQYFVAQARKVGQFRTRARAWLGSTWQQIGIICSVPTASLRYLMPDIVRSWVGKLDMRRHPSTSLARHNLARLPWRSGLTACGMMVAIAFIVDMSGDMRSVINLFERSLQMLSRVDCYVLPFKAGVGSPKPEWFRIPEIATVAEIRMLLADSPNLAGDSLFATGKLMLCGINPETFNRLIPLDFTQGDKDKALERLRRGEGIIISADLSRVSRLGLGDRIPIRTPVGVRLMTVCGVVRDPRLALFTDWRDWKDLRGLVGSYVAFCSIETMERLFGSVTPNLILLGFSDEFDFDKTLKKARGIAWRNGCRARPLNQQRDRIMRDAWTAFKTINAVLFVGIVIAALGVVNTMTLNVMERTREIGVLRALGAGRTQIVGMIISEALMIGLIGAVLGILAGLLLLHASLVLNREVIGLNTEMVLPLREIGFAVGGAILVTILAAIYPALRAVRINISRAVRME